MYVLIDAMPYLPYSVIPLTGLLAWAAIPGPLKGRRHQSGGLFYQPKHAKV